MASMHAAVREQRRDLGLIVGRRDLDHVHADEVDGTHDLAHGAQQLTGRHPAGLGVPVPGASPGSATSMSIDR